jgi:Ca2+-binding RTX toxin-like protein
MSKIFIASTTEAVIFEHGYLVYDGNDDPSTTNDQFIIRAGPTQTGEPFGNILVEAGFPSVTTGGIKSADSIDVDDNGTADVDPLIARNYTQIAIPDGYTASSLWTAMTAFVAGLGSVIPSGVHTGRINTGIDYDPEGPNSNGVLNSVLAAFGIKFADVTPYEEGNTSNSRLEIGDFIGHTHILDSNGNNTFTLRAYASKDFTLFDAELYTFNDNAGNDTIILEKGARLEIVKDSDAGSSNVVVMQDFELGILSLVSPFGSDDLRVQDNSVSASTFPLLVLGDQYAANGLAADILEFRGAGSALLKRVNLVLIPEEEGFGSITEIYTAFSDQADVTGSAGADRLYGDGQANELTGGRGADIIKGGVGTDHYVWNLGDGSDTVHDDWADSDQLVLGPGITSSMVDVNASGSDLLVMIDNAAGYGATIVIKDAASLESTFLGTHVQNVITEADPTTTTYLWGTYDEILEGYYDGADVITGADGVNDHIDGGDHDDILSGGSGDDYIEGGAGANDELYGGSGNDRLEDTDGGLLDGGADDDLLIAWGDAVLKGGSGHDVIFAHGEDITVEGGSGNDVISIDDPDAVATVDGGDDDDIIHFGGTAQTVIASDGDDVIFQDWGEGAETVIRFADTLDMEDLTLEIRPNARDLLITHPDGTILLVDYLLKPENWAIQFGTGTPVVLDTESLEYTYAGSDTVFFSGAQAINVAAITTGSGSDTIFTSNSNTTVNAGAGQDVVWGGAGNNEIHGGDDIDQLTGGAGDDEIYGDGGADRIEGNGGGDSLYGGDGNDTITVSDSVSAPSFSTIDGGAGNDTILIQRLGVDTYAAANTVYGGTGDDVITATWGENEIYGGDGNDTISIGAELVPLDATIIEGGAGNDTITLYGSDGTVDGGDGNDTITVTGDENTVSVGGGTNTLQLFGEDNIVVVDGGQSTITASGHTVVDFGSGVSPAALTFSYVPGTSDLIVDTGAAQVRLTGYLTNPFAWSVAFGGASSAFAISATNTDASAATENIDLTAISGNINDTVTTGSGDDIVIGLGGNDIISTNSGADFISGGDGNDTLSGGDGDDQIEGGDGIDNIQGGAGNDEIFGGDGADAIYGGTGVNELYGEGGNDLIDGSDGTADGSILSGGDGNDTVHGSAFADQIYGDDSSAGNDTIYGGGGNDIIFGGAGNDSIDGGAGNDLMVGGTGNDTYYIDSASDIVDEDENEGTDTLVSSIDISTVPAHIENVQFTGTAARTTTGNSLNNIISGSVGNDVFNGMGGNDTLYGYGGNDTLNGGADADTIYGGDGTDSISGGDGNDTIWTGSGADVVYGDGGNDTIYGLAGGFDAVTLYGGAGTDTIYGGWGNDAIEGGADADTVYGDLGQDTIEGGDGDDVIYGGDDPFLGSSDDTLYGDGGNDQIFGGSGNDTLYGGDGNDTLDGGQGADAMAGGAGDDTYYYDNTSDVITENSGEGVDLVYVSKNLFTLPDHVENLIFTGTLGRYGIGNGLDNAMTGTSGHDFLYGLDGADTLEGKGGNDTLEGGDGADIFLYGAGALGSGTDTITDFSTVEGDAIDLRYLLGAYDSGQDAIDDFVRLTTSGSNTILAIDAAGTGSSYTNLATLSGVTFADTVEDLVTAGSLIVE